MNKGAVLYTLAFFLGLNALARSDDDIGGAWVSYVNGGYVASGDDCVLRVIHERRYSFVRRGGASGVISGTYVYRLRSRWISRDHKTCAVAGLAPARGYDMDRAWVLSSVGNPSDLRFKAKFTTCKYSPKCQIAMKDDFELTLVKRGAVLYEARDEEPGLLIFSRANTLETRANAIAADFFDRLLLSAASGQPPVTDVVARERSHPVAISRATAALEQFRTTPPATTSQVTVKEAYPMGAAAEPDPSPPLLYATVTTVNGPTLFMELVLSKGGWKLAALGSLQ